MLERGIHWNEQKILENTHLDCKRIGYGIESSFENLSMHFITFLGYKYWFNHTFISCHICGDIMIVCCISISKDIFCPSFFLISNKFYWIKNTKYTRRILGERIQSSSKRTRIQEFKQVRERKQSYHRNPTNKER